MIDAHHYLCDQSAVHYTWLIAKGVERSFRDPSTIQREYLLDEFRAGAAAQGVSASVHIQLGAEDATAKATSY